MNRIERAVNRVEGLIEALPDERRRELQEKMTLDADELCVYQETKSLAQASGRLTLDEAMLVYHALNHWRETSTAMRVVVTKLMAELLGVEGATRRAMSC